MLHEQEGLRIWRNEVNKFVICELRYNADPSKRSDEWLEEAKSGLSPSRFAKEYLIEWDAMDGQKAFPEIVEKRSKIVVSPEAYTFGESQRYWAGYDHGMRNPAAFVVFTQDESSNIYAVWELYEPCDNMAQFVEKMKQCPYWNKIRYIVADPALWDKRGYSGDGMPISPYEMFTQYGVRNFVKGSRESEQTWLLLMRAYWADANDIQFRIMDNCVNLIEELEGLRYANMTELMAANKNANEKLVDKKNHAADATKYFMTFFRRQAQGGSGSRLRQWAYKW